MGDGDGRPGPTDSWVTLAGLARETSTIRLGTLVSAVTFRLPGPLAISVAEVDAMSGGPCRARTGCGLVRRRAHGLRHPVRHVRRALRAPHRAARDPHRPVVDPRRRDLRLRRAPLPAAGLARAAQARAAAAPPAHPGRCGPEAHPRSRRASPTSSTCPSTRSPTSPARSTTCAGPVRPPVATPGRSCTRRPSRLCAEPTRPRSSGGPGPPGARSSSRGSRVPTGTPDEVVEQLRAYADAGAERAYLQLLDIDDLDHVRLLAAEVAPHLA